MTVPETEGNWTVLIEGTLSNHSYGASIKFGARGDRGRAAAELDAILAGDRPDLMVIPDGARIVEFQTGQFGVVVNHRIRSAELTRISLVRLRR